MLESLADQPESVIVQPVIFGHRQLKIFYRYSQQPAILVCDGRVFPASSFGIERRLAEERTFRQNIDYGFAIGVRLDAAELDAPFDNRKKRVSLFGCAIDEPAPSKLDDARLLCKFGAYGVSQV